MELLTLSHDNRHPRGFVHLALGMTHMGILVVVHVAPHSPQLFPHPIINHFLRLYNTRLPVLSPQGFIKIRNDSPVVGSQSWRERDHLCDPKVKWAVRVDLRLGHALARDVLGRWPAIHANQYHTCWNLEPRNIQYYWN